VKDVAMMLKSQCFAVRRHADGLPSNTRSLLTVSALLSVALWVRVLYFLLGFKDTGALVRMVIQIIVDMRYFLLLMVMIAIGAPHPSHRLPFPSRTAKFDIVRCLFLWS
jgi:hypothetical protein